MIMFSACPSVCPSPSGELDISGHYFKKSRKFLKIWHKRPLGLEDELIRFWWSKVKDTELMSLLFS